MDFMKILVLEASGLHLGFIGCYGNDWVATPNLDRLAAESIVFDQHIADYPELAAAGPWQQRSAVTGRYAFVDAPPNEFAPDGIHYEAIEELGEFARRSIRVCERSGSSATILWINGPCLAPPWQLPDDLLNIYADEEADDPAPLAVPPRGLVELTIDELEHLQTTYAAVVTFYDAQLGHIVQHLREANQLDDLLLCVTARCGLPLGEHGMVGAERPWPHDEFVHTPLLIRLPGAAQGGLRIAALTQPIDLTPTFAAFLGLASDAAHGRSLLPLIRGETEPMRPYAVTLARGGGAEEWLLRAPDRALLVPKHAAAGDPERKVALYVKPDDRWEANDLALRYEEEVGRLQQTLHAFIAAAQRTGLMVYPPLPEESAALVEEPS
jgi:arylsulfatase A-like enzyme